MIFTYWKSSKLELFSPNFSIISSTLKGDEESQQLFLRALRNVAEAQGGVGALARKVHIRRENLYRILSEGGNPELKTFTMLLEAMGFSLKVA